MTLQDVGNAVVFDLLVRFGRVSLDDLVVLKSAQEAARAAGVNDRVAQAYVCVLLFRLGYEYVGDSYFILGGEAAWR